MRDVVKEAGPSPPPPTVPRPCRLRRDRRGRIPYALAAMVILSALLVMLSSMLLTRSLATAGEQGPEPVYLQGGLLSLSTTLQGVVVNATLTQTALLANQGLGSQLTSLESRVISAVGATLAGDFAANTSWCHEAETTGGVTFCLDGWALNITEPSFETEEVAPVVTTTGAGVPQLDSETPTNLTTTGSSPFVGVEGYFTLSARGPGGTTATGTYPYLQTTQIPLGLFDSSYQLWSTGLSGGESDFARLAQYILETFAEVRALQGVGAGGYGGPDASTNVQELLTPADVALAANLSLEISTLEAFRSVDPAIVSAFVAGLPPGADGAIFRSAITNGTLDAATLALAILPPTGGWASTPVAANEGLAQALASFSNRFTFDLYRTFWGTEAIDPTLSEPVATWYTLWGSGMGSWITARLQQYLQDYQQWLGSQYSTLPFASTKITYPNLEFEAQVSCTSGGNTITEDENYTLLPGGTYTVTPSITGTPTDEVLALLYGDASAAAPFDPGVLQLGSDLAMSHAGNTYTNDTTLSYQLVDESFLGEYTSSANPENATFSQLLVDLNDSMAEDSLLASDAGYLPTIAEALVGAGTLPADPDLGSVLPTPGTSGEGAVMNSSWSYFDQGIPDLYTDAYDPDLSALSAEAPTEESSWFVAGAEHPSGEGTGPDPGAPDSLADAARLAVRLLYQVDYGLYYGSVNGVPTTQPGVTTPSFFWKSSGDTPAPPVAGADPNFALDLERVLYTYTNEWITGNTYANDLSNYTEAPPVCAATPAAYNDAVTWFNTAGNLWDWLDTNVVTPVQQQGFGSASSVGSLKGAFQAVASDTGNDSWQSGAFTGWVEKSVGGPLVLPDYLALTEGTNSWLAQLFDSSETWTEDEGAIHAVAYQPEVLSDAPYTFWGENSLGASAASNLLVLSPPELSMQVVWTEQEISRPSADLHLVDAQATGSNMGLAPFQANWTVAISGRVSATLTEPSTLLPGSSGVRPLQLHETVPLNASFPVTVVTPWPLQSGYDGAPTDPQVELARGYLGIVSAVPYSTYTSADVDPISNCASNCQDWDLLQNAFYPAVDLDQLLDDAGQAASWNGASTAVESSILASMPFETTTSGTTTSSAWDEVVSVTAGVVGAGAPLATQVDGLAAQLHRNLTAIRYPALLTFLDGGFFGASSATINTRDDLLTYDQAFPTPDGVSPPDAEDMGVAFADGDLGITSTYLASSSGPSQFQLYSDWQPGGSEGTAGNVTASWSWLGQGSNFSLVVPRPAEALQSDASSLTDLNAPTVGRGLPASIFVAASPAVPAASSSALTRSVQTWLGGSAPTFSAYLRTMQYVAGYYDDALLSGTPGSNLALWEMGTSLLLPGDHQWTETAVSFNPQPGPVPVSIAGALPWAEETSEDLWSSLNDTTPDYGVFAYLPYGYLNSLDWNVSTGTCGASACTSAPSGAVDLGAGATDTGVYLSVNFAALLTGPGGLGEGAHDFPLCSLGGTGGGHAWSATLELY